MATKHDYADFHGLPGPSRLTKALGSSPLELIVRAEAPVLELDGVDWETVLQDAALVEPARHCIAAGRGSWAASGPWRRPSRGRAKSSLRPSRTRSSCTRCAGGPAGPFDSEPRRASSSTGRPRQQLAELGAPRIVTLRLDGRPIAFAYYFALGRRCAAIGSPSTRPPRLSPGREPVRHPGQRLRRRRDAGRVLRRHGALQDGAHRPDGAAPRGLGSRTASPARPSSPRG